LLFQPSGGTKSNQLIGSNTFGTFRQFAADQIQIQRRIAGVGVAVLEGFDACHRGFSIVEDSGDFVAITIHVIDDIDKVHDLLLGCCFNHLAARNQEIRHPLNLWEMAMLSFKQRM
jgi:hypothetical protein